MNLLTELYPAIAVRRFCSVFGKTRQSWYYVNSHAAMQDMRNSMVVKLVNEIREQQPRIGTRKLYHLLAPQLQLHKIKIGRDQLFDVLEQYGLLIRHRRRKAITTNSNHRFYKYENLIQQLQLHGKNQLWVSDITYIRLKENFAYLSLITDAFSRKIVGYCLLNNLSAQGPIAALNTALEQQRPRRDELIHHSDRGVQYCCDDYVQRLSAYQIKISMSAKGDPYQNAIAERVNGILKEEYGLNQTFSSMDQASVTVYAAVEKYNSIRPHDSLNYLTPNQAHQLTGIIKRNWKNYNKQQCTVNQD